MNNYNKLFENWNKFLNEEELKEVTDEELEDIDEILHDLKPEDLSFGNIFGDKMRLITPMKTKDRNLQALKRTLKLSGYEPDFSTGLANYYSFSLPAMREGDKPTTIILTPEQMEHLVDDDGQIKRLETDTDESFEKRKKKIQKKQIKIGKLLQKGSRLYDNAHEAWKVHDEMYPDQFGISPTGDDPAADNDEEKVKEYHAAYEAATDKSKKERQKLFDVFQGAQTIPSSALNPYQQLADWWNKKSAFYRENPEAAAGDATTSSEYSIVYSRHPLDVLRMSDFDRIETCHSPSSRGGGGSYYKCAVAEAHGHGPIAYVVKTSDLDSILVDSALPSEASHQELLDFIEENDEELFLDTERGTGEIEPLSRVRLKKFVNPTLKMSLAVPSTQVYGKRFPNLYNNISAFTKEKQAEELKKIDDSKNSDNPFDSAFDENGKFNLSNWERYGGSYQDGGDYPGEAITKWLGFQTVGNTHYDSTQEDNLSVNGSVMDRWNAEVNEIRDEWNNRMQAIKISAHAEDDGAGEAYIEVSAKLNIAIGEDEFISTAFSDATRKSIEYLPSHLIEYGYDWLNDYVSYTTANPNNADWADLIRLAQEEAESLVTIEIPVDMEKANEEGAGYAYDPDNFREICRKLDEYDDQADNITTLAKSYLKREGIIKGGGLHKLASAIADESWYEWDYEVDDEYDTTSIELETTTYVNFNDLIKKIPITFDHQPDKSSEIFIMFAGDPIALASRRDDGEGNFIDFEVRSPEFETERMDGFKGMDAIKEYVQWEVTKMILRPKGQMGGRIPKGYESTRDYLIAMKEAMRAAAGGRENEFMFPRTSMWVNGPDADDEYRMMYKMSMDEDTPDEATQSALEIITETDDEDILKEIFRKAFAKVAKIPGETVQETRKYFKKFDIF